MGLHLVEIHAAERGKERTEHHHREDGIDNGTKGIASGIEPRHKIEHQINDGADGYGARQSPIFYKLLDIHAAKIIKINNG